MIKIYFKLFCYNFFTIKTLYKVLVIFIFGFLSRWFVDSLTGINVFLDFCHYISITYYLLFSSFIVFVHNLVDFFYFISEIKKYAVTPLTINYPSFQYDTKDPLNEIKSYTLFKNNNKGSSKIIPNNGSSSLPVASNHNNLTSAEVAKKHKLVSKSKFDNLRGFNDTSVSNPCPIPNPNPTPNPNPNPNTTLNPNPNPNLKPNTNPNPNLKPNPNSNSSSKGLNTTETLKFTNQDYKVNKVNMVKKENNTPLFGENTNTVGVSKFSNINNTKKTDNLNTFTKIKNISLSCKRKMFNFSIELKKSLKKDVSDTIHTFNVKKKTLIWFLRGGSDGKK